MSEAVPSRLALETAHIWRKISGRHARDRRAAKRRFAEAVARLRPGRIAADLGANAGEFTVPMARTGATVYAFEPDPHAFGLLERATREFPNVTRIQAAAGTENGSAVLYRSTAFVGAPDRRSKSSSLFAEKRNVDAEHAVDVELVDFPAFLAGLDDDVALIKIDIEGAEVPLLEALLDHPVAPRIAEIFVETHERKLPHLARRTEALKRRAAALAAPRINWDWH